MMKQRWGLDRNVLRPTPGDPWGVEQHHWNTGAEENQQLNPGGPSNRQKSSGPNQLKPEDHWSCIAHLIAEDMLKSAVIEEKKFKILNVSDLDQGQWLTLTFGTHKALI